MFLVLEVSFSGKEHGYAELVAFLDGVFVADRTAGLDYGLDTVLRGQGDAVIKREERIGG